MNLLIRADSDLVTGTGHIMRTLALAQACRDEGGTVTFLYIHCPFGLQQRLNNDGFITIQFDATPGSLEDAKITSEQAIAANCHWVIADGYKFDENYQIALKAFGERHSLKLLMLDDYGHSKKWWADIVLNQNLHANSINYNGASENTRLLLGTRYALLRREFWRYRGINRDIKETATNVLVTLGGGDHENVTSKVISGLKEMKDIQVKVIVGASNPHIHDIQHHIASSANPSAFCALRNVENMPELMRWADVAFAGGGSTSWELALMGLPSIVTTVALNQVDIVKSLQDTFASICLGWHSDIPSVRFKEAWMAIRSDKRVRSNLSTTAQSLVDGYGVKRVLEVISSVATPKRP